MWTYIYVEYGDSCDGFPRITNRSWSNKEDAFKAIEGQAKVNCADTTYWYDIISPGKIAIYDEYNNSTIMTLCVVEIPGLPLNFEIKNISKIQEREK